MRVTWVFGNILERTGCGNGSGYSAWFVIEDDKQHVVFHRDNASEKLILR